MKYLVASTILLLATLAINAQSLNFKYDRLGDFKEGMAQVFVGSKFGFIDISGKEVIPPIYEDNFPHYEFNNGFIVLKKDNLLGIVDKTGKVIAPFEFKSIGSFSNGIAEATKPGTKVGFIDQFGRTVIPFQYDIFILLGGVKCIDAMIPVENNTNKKGYIHKSGNLVVPFKYEVARNFSNGLGLVKRVFNGKVSYLNNFGAAAIPEKYDDGRDFIDGFAAVNMGAKQTPTYELSGGKWGLIDKSGKEVVPFIYDRIYENKNGFAIVANGKYPNEKKGLIKVDGKVILPVEFNDIKMLNGRFIAKKEFAGPYALFDMTGNKITDFKWYFSDLFADFSDGLIAVRELVNGKLGKAGVIDLNGVLKIPYRYDIIGNFKEGLAQVAINNKYGAIDKNGKVVIPLVYDYLNGFSEGWSGVTKNGKSGFINKAGILMALSKNSTPTVTSAVKAAEPIASGKLQFKNDFFGFIHVMNGVVQNKTTGDYSGAKVGILTKNNAVVVLPRYDWVGIDTANKIFFVYSGVNVTFNQNFTAKIDTTANTRIGIIDYNGKQVYPQSLANYKSLPNKFILVQDAITKKEGVLDSKLLPIIPFKYDLVYNFTDSAIAAQQNGKFGIINLKNEIIMPFEYDTLYDGGALSPGGYRIIKNGKTILVSGKGKIKKTSPEPQESKYQSALSRAKNTNERVAALNEYYLTIKNLGFANNDIESLLGDKFLQMTYIDFHSVFQALMSNKIKFDDVKLYQKSLEVLTREQRNAIKLLAQYTVDDFVATQNNRPRPAYPAGVPKPGFGWGKN